MSSSPSTDELAIQLKQIDEAAKLAFQNNDYFVQILDTIIAISISQPIENYKLQINCLNFIYKSFVLKKIDSFNLRFSNCLKLVDLLSRFLLIDDIFINLNKINYKLLQISCEILASTYNLIFLNLIDSPNKAIWLKISNLKDFLISKLSTSYPLLPLNNQTDLNRSIGFKISLIKLLTNIIITQLPPPPHISSNSNSNSNSNIEYNDSLDISILLVNKDHPFLYNSNLNSQSQYLIDLLIGYLNNDNLISTTLFSTIISNLMKIFKLRSNFISNKLINFILNYESQFKISSKFESNQIKIRLIKRFNDKLDKIFMSMLLNRGFIEKDLSLKDRFSRKLSYMNEKLNLQKKRGILSLENDDDDNNSNSTSSDLHHQSKRRKLDPISTPDFYDESKFVKFENFKSLYTLINSSNELTNFDISQIPNNILNNIIITGLKNITNEKLNKGLQIISDRYLDLIKRFEFKEKQKRDLQDLQKSNQLNKKLVNPLNSPNKNPLDISTKQQDEKEKEKEEQEQEQEEEEEEENYNPSIKEEKPTTKTSPSDDDDFDFEIESKNFQLPIPKLLDPNEKIDQLKLIIDNFIENSINENPLTNDIIKPDPQKLNKKLITKWDNKSWLKILIRLSNRGTNLNPEISNYIKASLFNYFKIDIKLKIDDLIQWLNEEYYNDFIIHHNNNNNNDDDIMNSTYFKYTSLTLDYLIPFIELTDRNLFIRLLSELPYLNLPLISKLKSICNDPIRFKIGFQSLLYLIMFRPPILNDCLQFLIDLYNYSIEKDNKQLTTECLNYLKKYKPDFNQEIVKNQLTQEVKQDIKAEIKAEN